MWLSVEPRWIYIGPDGQEVFFVLLLICWLSLCQAYEPVYNYNTAIDVSKKIVDNCLIHDILPGMNLCKDDVWRARKALTSPLTIEAGAGKTLGPCMRHKKHSLQGGKNKCKDFHRNPDQRNEKPLKQEATSEQS